MEHNMFCEVSLCKVYGPFFFAEATIIGIYLDIQQWPMPQPQLDNEDFIFHENRSPSHFHLDVRTNLNAHLPRC